MGCSLWNGVNASFGGTRLAVCFSSSTPHSPQSFLHRFLLRSPTNSHRRCWGVHPRREQRWATLPPRPTLTSPNAALSKKFFSTHLPLISGCSTEGGDVITVQGQLFGVFDSRTSAVSVNGMPCCVGTWLGKDCTVNGEKWSETSIECALPPGAGLNRYCLSPLGTASVHEPVSRENPTLLTIVNTLEKAGRGESIWGYF